MNMREPTHPVSDAEMTPEQRDLTDKLRVNGVLANGFRVGLRAWPLFQAHLPFSLYVMAQSSVPARLRELAIIRIAHNTRCDYEFRHHSQGAMGFLGFSQQDIERIREGADAEGLSEIDAQLIRLVDQLSANCALPDEMYTYFVEELGEETFTELLFTIGNYESMTRVINVLGIPMDEDFDVMHGLTDNKQSA